MVAVKAQPGDQVFGQFVAYLSGTVLARFDLPNVSRHLEVDLGDAQCVAILTCSSVGPVRSDFPNSVLFLRLVEFELDHGHNSHLIVIIPAVLVEHKVSQRVEDRFPLVQLNVHHTV